MIVSRYHFHHQECASILTRGTNNKNNKQNTNLGVMVTVFSSRDTLLSDAEERADDDDDGPGTAEITQHNMNA